MQIVSLSSFGAIFYFEKLFLRVDTLYPSVSRFGGDGMRGLSIPELERKRYV